VGSKEAIFTGRAPKPIGPYSQAVRAGDFLFVSGQIALDPSTGELVKGGIEEQTERILENAKAILEDSGFSLDDVVMVTVFLKDLRLYGRFNSVYSKYFGEGPPARTVVEVSDLPKGALVEVNFIAYRGSKDR